MSTGETIANPRRLRHSERQLAQAQRNLARNRKTFKNRGQARLTVARLQAKIADSVLMASTN